MEAVELLQNSIDATQSKVAELSEKLSAMGGKVTEQVKGDFDEKFSELNSKIDELKQAQAAAAMPETNAKKYGSVGDEFLCNYKNNQGKIEINAIKAEDVGGGVYRWGGMQNERIR